MLYLLFTTVQQMTLKLSTFKQRVCIISQLPWVRNPGVQLGASGSESLTRLHQGDSHLKAHLGGTYFQTHSYDY